MRPEYAFIIVYLSPAYVSINVYFLRFTNQINEKLKILLFTSFKIYRSKLGNLHKKIIGKFNFITKKKKYIYINK